MATILPDGCVRLYDRFDGDLDFDTGVAQCVSVWMVPFAQLIPFVAAVAGGAYAGRVLRMEHPVIPGMFAMGIRWKAAGNSADANMYSFYYCEVGFATLNFPLDGDLAYLRFTEQGSARETTFPGRALRAGGTPLGQDVALPETTVAFTITSHNLAAVPRAAAIAAAEEPVNDDTFFGYAAGYVFFESWSSDWSLTLGGIPSYTAEFHFKARPRRKWNEIYHPTTGALTAVTLPDDTTPMLASSNLMALFTP
jgi:hypothetical protein